jgi:exonuclease SbcD
MTREETENLSLAEINHLLMERLAPVIEAEIRQLDPALPTILLAHLMADRASLGAERFLAVGKGFTIPAGFLTRDCFDYVALGHVHKHQNLNPSNDPPVIYPGSIERVDFSEEKEEKGYVMIQLERGKADWQFCPLPARVFQTIEVDLSKSENPQADLEKAIAKKQIKEAVVRLIYKVHPDQLSAIALNALQEHLVPAHSYTIQAELISQLSVPRVPELGVDTSVDPLAALQTYLDHHSRLQAIGPQMLEAAQRLLATNRT